MTPILKELKKGKIPLCWLFRKYGKKIPKWLEWLIGDPATIFTDDFNSYTDGDLNGQGGWAGGTDFDIQGTTVCEGAKAVKLLQDAATQEIEKSGTLTNDGRVSFYARRSGNVGYAEVKLLEGTGNKVWTDFDPNGNWRYHNGGSYVVIGAISSNVWHLCEIEWRSSDHYARYRLNEGTWTNWDSAYSAWTSGLDKLSARIYNPANFSESFIDYIAENPYPTQISVSDSGVGTDALVIKRTIPVADSGAGVETIAIKGEIPIADSGSGADAIGVKQFKSLADSGSGVDTIGILSKVLVQDLGAGVDLVQTKGAISISDSGIGADIISVISPGKVLIQDSGIGVDLISAIKAKLSIADSGSGVDLVDVIKEEIVQFMTTLKKYW